MFAILESQTSISVSILVPEFRSYVLHECDTIEDVAIAYGFNSFVTEYKVYTLWDVKTFSIGFLIRLGRNQHWQASVRC